jgi:hypothetical protein
VQARVGQNFLIVTPVAFSLNLGAPFLIARESGEL